MIKKYFENRYKDIFANGQSGSMSLNINNAMLSFFRDININIFNATDTETFIDYGCGVGKMVHFLTEHFKVKNYIGIDIVKDAVDWCKILYPFATFRQYDLEPCDIIWCSFVLQHLPRKEVIDILKDFKKNLNKGGKCYITNAVVKGQDTDVMFYRSVRDYKEIFKEAGFKSRCAFITQVSGSEVACFEIE